MSAKIVFDLGTFRRGIQHKLSRTRKAKADVVNQACGSIAANAIKFTPKAEKGKIRLLDPKILAAAVAKKLRVQGKIIGRGSLADVQRDAKGHFIKGSGARSKTSVSRAEFKRLMRQEKARRVRSVGYIAAGWFKPLAVFRPNSRRKVSEKGLAGKGTGKKATASDPVGELTNFARGAGKVGARALQQALDNEGRFMLSYGNKKLAEALK